MTVKTQAAKIIEALCDNIDGAVSFITFFACQSINMSLRKKSIEGIPYDFSSFNNSAFLQSSPEIIAETCLVALTTISYILPRRQDLVPIFDRTLAENVELILSQGSIILRARMSLLLGYYADMLF
jgi:hypothetical protein